MVLIYHSPIPEERRGIIYSFKSFLPGVTGLEEGGEGQHPVLSTLLHDGKLKTRSRKSGNYSVTDSN
jgi:hypothetical protein